MNLDSEVGSHRDDRQREERRKPREYYTESHREDDRVSRHEDNRRYIHKNHLVDSHRARDEVARRIALLEKRLNPPRGNFEVTEVVGYQPFVREIQEAPALTKFRQPTLDKYEGKTYPVEHLSHFNAMVGLFDYGDTTLCKLFPSTFKGAARTWYSSLKPNTIGSFKELSRQFLNAFMSRRKVD